MTSAAEGGGGFEMLTVADKGGGGLSLADVSKNTAPPSQASSESGVTIQGGWGYSSPQRFRPIPPNKYMLPSP